MIIQEAALGEGAKIVLLSEEITVTIGTYLSTNVRRKRLTAFLDDGSGHQRFVAATQKAGTTEQHLADFEWLVRSAAAFHKIPVEQRDYW